MQCLGQQNLLPKKRIVKKLSKNNLQLTSLSVSRSTLQCKKPVWPTVTVMFLGTSKSKYGSRLVGEMVVDVVDSPNEGAYDVRVSEIRTKFQYLFQFAWQFSTA